MIIAVDFDGTCVGHLYPDLGPDVPGCVDTLKKLAADGHRLILYTMRSGRPLEEALWWSRDRGITWWGVNQNPEQHTWTESPKVYAHVYIDDAAYGCRLRPHPSARVKRPCVDWTLLYETVSALDRKPHH